MWNVIFEQPPRNSDMLLVGVTDCAANLKTKLFETDINPTTFSPWMSHE